MTQPCPPPPRPVLHPWPQVLRQRRIYLAAAGWVALVLPVTLGAGRVDLSNLDPQGHWVDSMFRELQKSLAGWAMVAAVLTGALLGLLQALRRQLDNRRQLLAAACAGMTCGALPLGVYGALEIGVGIVPWGLAVGAMIAVTGVLGSREALGPAIDPHGFAAAIDHAMERVTARTNRTSKPGHGDVKGGQQ